MYESLIKCYKLNSYLDNRMCIGNIDDKNTPKVVGTSIELRLITMLHRGIQLRLNIDYQSSINLKLYLYNANL